MTDPDAGQSEAPVSKTEAKAEPKAKTDAVSLPKLKPIAKDDLKSLPLAEVEKKLGSSPDGLSQAEAAEAADPIRAQRD